MTVLVGQGDREPLVGTPFSCSAQLKWLFLKVIDRFRTFELFSIWDAFKVPESYRMVPLSPLLRLSHVTRRSVTDLGLCMSPSVGEVNVAELLSKVLHDDRDIMLTSSVSRNGLPADLEFTLDEISTELAKLGVKETSPTRLAAIKADLDRLIARDLETLSTSLNKETSTTSPRSRSDSASFSSDDVSTITSDSGARPHHRSLQPVEGEEDEGNDETCTPEESSWEGSSTVSDSRGAACSGSRRYRRSGNSCILWGFTHSFFGDVSSVARRINGSRAPLRSSPLENLDYDRNLSSSSSVSSRRPMTAGRASWRSGGGVNRGDPVSLWRLYNSQWERQARATAVSERALRWSVKAAMAVREVPLLASSRRSLHFGPSSVRHRNYMARH
ncbi:unnamed protein product [Taenia asiatica]|uniref:Uncharacterized protein n=1 Tax=Taenia asiatica TaxID=60517 RepID=A0A0R3WBX4_TAEAS|nr:unnamed protein product [Taenia asiatica]